MNILKKMDLGVIIAVIGIVLAIVFWIFKPQDLKFFFASHNISVWVYVIFVALIISLFFVIFYFNQKNKLQIEKEKLEKEKKELQIEAQELKYPEKKIRQYFDKYMQTDLGKKYIKDNNVYQELINQTYSSMDKIINDPNREVVEENMYYLYLFSLLTGVERHIWVVSRLDEKEWTDTPKESEFLRLNLEVTKKKDNPVLLERIFLVDRNQAKTIKDKENVVAQIKARSVYLKTYIAFCDEYSPSLINKVGEGILGFDNFVVTRDVFDEEFIRGNLFFDKETINQDYRTFIEVKDKAKALTKELLETL